MPRPEKSKIYDAIALARFWSKVDMESSACWIWRSMKNEDGYGRFSYRGSKHSAHRFSYSLFFGEIQEGTEIDHLCRSRDCVNPFHLEAVSHKENISRGMLGKLRTHCKHGHPLSGENLRIETYGGKTRRRCLICVRANATKCRLRKAHRKLESQKDVQ